jgi:hypothetical protein
MGQIVIALLATGPILGGLIWAICLLIHDQRQTHRQIRSAIRAAQVARTKQSYPRPPSASGKPGPRVSVSELLQRAIEQKEPIRLNWVPDQLDEAGRVLPQAQNESPTEVLPKLDFGDHHHHANSEYENK